MQLVAHLSAPFYRPWNPEGAFPPMGWESAGLLRSAKEGLSWDATSPGSQAGGAAMRERAFSVTVWPRPWNSLPLESLPARWCTEEEKETSHCLAVTRTAESVPSLLSSPQLAMRSRSQGLGQGHF